MLLICSICAAHAAVQTADLSPAALKMVTPDGYKVEKVLPAPGTRNEYLVALSDVDVSHLIAERPVTLLLIAIRDNRAIVEDTVLPHAQRAASNRYRSAPNYLSGMTTENLSGGALVLVWSVLSGGGSGAEHYFDFFQTDAGKLRLVKSFVHGRMERLYLAVHKGAIYDADVQCKRGEKHGNAYVYTCTLNVTKYVFDGQAIVPVASERLRERKGNRYLSDSYRNMSILPALRNGEIFRQAPP